MSGGRTPTGPAGDREHGRRVRSGTRDRTSTARGMRLAAASPARVPVMGWRDPAVSHGSTQPRVPPGSHDRVPVLLHAAGNVGPAGRRLCDPVWHVRSRCGQTGRCTPPFTFRASRNRIGAGPARRRGGRRATLSGSRLLLVLDAAAAATGAHDRPSTWRSRDIPTRRRVTATPGGNAKIRVAMDGLRS